MGLSTRISARVLQDTHQAQPHHLAQHRLTVDRHQDRRGLSVDDARRVVAQRLALGLLRCMVDGRDLTQALRTRPSRSAQPDCCTDRVQVASRAIRGGREARAGRRRCRAPTPCPVPLSSSVRAASETTPNRGLSEPGRLHGNRCPAFETVALPAVELEAGRR